ncbi:hypothetical protein B0H17DRAFT_1144416 [Mycena rosella]|uniref:Uncharacterized protein n=1 Tax=Mycena rosella TaxID=1033263 RepID=A0AAD7CSZ0_MYCRO|nr:hypothetical protein B0H17DRAFT_1144416 [Mycena rosella]
MGLQIMLLQRIGSKQGHPSRNHPSATSKSGAVREDKEKGVRPIIWTSPSDFYPSEISTLEYVVLARDLSETWNLLLSTIFNPPSRGPAGIPSMGNRVAREELTDLSTAQCWKQVVQPFLAQNQTKSIRERTAEFALQFLSCRTAKMKSYINDCSSQHPSALYKHHTKDDAADYFWSTRGASRWNFTGQWCQHLIHAPPSSDLLILLDRLLGCKIKISGLMSWLQQFTEERTVRLVEVFKGHNSRRVGCWCLIDYSGGDLATATSGEVHELGEVIV